MMCRTVRCRTASSAEAAVCFAPQLYRPYSPWRSHMSRTVPGAVCARACGLLSRLPAFSTLFGPCSARPRKATRKRWMDDVAGADSLLSAHSLLFMVPPASGPRARWPVPSAPQPSARGAAGEEEEVGAAAAAAARGPQAAPRRAGVQPGLQAAGDHAQRQVQAAAAQAGARQGLAAHGAGVCGQPGAAQAAGGAQRGGPLQGARAAAARCLCSHGLSVRTQAGEACVAGRALRRARAQVDDLRGSPMSVGNLEEIIDEKCASPRPPCLLPPARTAVPRRSARCDALTLTCETRAAQPRDRVVLRRARVLRQHHVVRGQGAAGARLHHLVAQQGARGLADAARQLSHSHCLAGDHAHQWPKAWMLHVPSPFRASAACVPSLATAPPQLGMESSPSCCRDRGRWGPRCARRCSPWWASSRMRPTPWSPS